MFWAKGYAVSTVGYEEEKVRRYIRHQEHLDHKEDGEDQNSEPFKDPEKDWF